MNTRLLDLSSKSKTVETTKVYPVERYTNALYGVDAVDDVENNISTDDVLHVSNLSSEWGEAWDISDNKGHHCSREEQMGQVVVNDINGCRVHSRVSPNAKGGAWERRNIGNE